ncbi:stalk domain-containing protein [Paenibacillus assamensis]|uniref:stalk domain-containing protein n=1 Tax=Paenibacillus assamensis TaxID=311244 RepID=UPI000407CD56|nr:stalk domain-containing protein [Paenibacillus assamensis]
MIKKWIAGLSIVSMLSVAAIPAYAAPAVVKSTITNFESNSIVKKDGSVWVWGQQQSAPTQVHDISDVAYIVDNTFIVKKDHSVYFLQKSFADSREQEVIPIEGLYGVKEVIGNGYNKYILLDQKGQVYDLNVDNEDLEKPLSDLLVPIEGLKEVSDLSYYSYHIANKSQESYWLALKKDGTVWQSKMNQSTPANQVPIIKDIVEIKNNLALQKNGSLWAFPKQVSSVEQAVPSLVKGVGKMESIYADYDTQVAIDSQSRLWFLSGTVTGYSDGTKYDTGVNPVQLKTIAEVKGAFIVERDLLAWTKNGDVFRTTIQREKMPSNPKFELLAKDVVQIASGSRHIIFEKKDGSLWGWGINKHAQLGHGTYEFSYDKPVPVQKPIVVEWNGKSVPLTNGVIVRNDQAFIPLRSVFGSMGAEIKWNAENKQALITQKQANETTTVISINFATGETKVNDKPVKLQTAPFISGDTAFLPLRFVSETLGAKVNWSKQDDKISIAMQ